MVPFAPDIVYLLREPFYAFSSTTRSKSLDEIKRSINSQPHRIFTTAAS